MEELLAELRRAGEEPEQALLDRIEAQGPAVVQPLVAMALDTASQDADAESPEVWAPLYAVRLLKALAPAEAVGPLLPLLASDSDWLVEELVEVFGRIGEPALAPLRTLLFDRSQDMWARARAGDALEQIAQNHPELREEVVAALMARLVPEQSQVPDDETLNGLTVSRLLALKAKEAVPAIMQAFDEDRVDLRIVTRESLQELDVPVPAKPKRLGRTLYLWLRCTACHYERPHELEKVYYDLGTADRRKEGEETPYDPIIIPQRITCPKCGAVDHYELTGDAHLAITAQMLRLMAGAEETAGAPGGRSQAADDGPLIMTRFSVAGDREMHPYAARDMYREQVAAEPDNADLRLRYANVLHFVGRDDEAVEQYQAAVQLDPAGIEAHLNLGVLAEKAGRREEARRQFERVVELAPGSQMPRQERENYLLFARSQLGVLPGGARTSGSIPSPVAGRWDWRIEPAPSRTSPHAPRSARKVGRNEPCPCGSGKKYKKCCGR